MLYKSKASWDMLLRVKKGHFKFALQANTQLGYALRGQLGSIRSKWWSTALCGVKRHLKCISPTDLSERLGECFYKRNFIRLGIQLCE